MATIFISYAQVDRPIVQLLAQGLAAHGLDVWWDLEILGGDEFPKVVSERIAAAKIVMPVWTAASVRSKWVWSEADAGKDKLLPVRLEDVTPPLPFTPMHAVDLVGWRGDASDPRWRRLLADVDRKLGREAASPPVAAPHVRRFPFLPAAAASLAAVAILAWAALGRDDRGASPEVAPSPPSVATAPAPAPAASSGLALELCEADGARRCGLTQVRAGQAIQVKVISAVSGRLLLIDESVEGRYVQIFPNGLTPANADLLVTAGTPTLLPDARHEFDLVVEPPFGQARLHAIVQPAGAALAPSIEENRRLRGLRVIEKGQAWTTQADSGELVSGRSGGVEKTVLTYAIVPE